MAGSSSSESIDRRSLEGITKGVASILPPSFNTEDDDDCGLEPSQLYREFTWMISNYSKINKIEVSSNSFEVGGYKWCFVLYPLGCDVHDHLSLFLWVADRDKLLPGWSHCAQFTMCLVNKDTKKSKYSDALHRFWKKEPDWGWKKFIKLSEMVRDGFIDADTDTLVVKAKVQVIRERVDRPFQCLTSDYKRELARIYMSNVEEVCNQFVKETRGKLEELKQHKARWSSFCNFWLGLDQKSRKRLARVKSDFVLEGFVKHFFTKKEASTSALMMDSLYSELKTLKGQTKSEELEAKCDSKVPAIQMESDSFILVNDLLPLLERMVLEPLPLDDESQTKGSIENYERRLAELGCRIIELSVLAYMSSKIEVAGQEEAALKRQEELIREEEEEKAKAKTNTKPKTKTKTKTKSKIKTKTFM